ncbi:bifunctional P-450/NADPH-P450 reductase [Roridomyces roridus]|uniref:Bifunctional P-450/NADPH-P450 reductase n=1 Tax=Roridomyces roridus TaxID=1738132 RepID=A0AAD7FSR8_9AGAR|nr:bifunctional P-450/NADPH-P450 reductase [Roridomyces roridus]
MSLPIPQPPAIPFIGNVTALDKDVPLFSQVLLAKTYGEIFKLNILGTTLISCNTYALCNELSDEKRFKKFIAGGLLEVRHVLGDALFTGTAEEDGYGIAHRLLMPAFGTISVQGMMDDMRDICDQLILKWARFGPEAVLDPADDFTRLTLDTIAYCSMSYRINSFYTEGQMPFVAAMTDFLIESDHRSTRPRVVQALVGNAKFEKDIKTMTDLGDRIVAERQAHPTEKKDLLNTMLHSRDPKTGKGMGDDSISRNLITFLIAGHETSSGMLTFTVYHLLKTPDALRKLRAEIDSVLGDRPAQAEDFGKMPYLKAVMYESLRLTPTAPKRGVTALEDTTLGGGKYFVKAGTPIILQVWNMHRDPAVWGDDAELFRPERMLDGKFEALPSNAWQPFGFGTRGCIGRPFAWQEVALVLATVFQKFDVSLADPSYTLQIKQTLTIKPKGFFIHARPRTGKAVFYATPASTLRRGAEDSSQVTSTPQQQKGKPLYVFYGSNTGTSEAFAQRVANAAPSHGFSASIGTLDSAVGKIPTDGPVVIITASFEGQPADNAASFVDWLRHLEGSSALPGVRYAVFGCGNSDWAATYQAIPKLCDTLFEERGATRLVSRGSGDAGTAAFFQTFDEWEAGLWEVLVKEYGTAGNQGKESGGFEVRSVDSGKERAVALRQDDALLGRVLENRVLTRHGPVKRHIEFELPEGTTARAGDYIAILPQNPPRDVHRVLARFGLSNEEEVVISATGPTSLPVNKPVKLWEVLTGYVELGQPATTRDLTILHQSAAEEKTKSHLEALKASYTDAVVSKRISVLQILEDHPDISISLGTFLQMLPSMRVRQYSISSSPLWNPSHITVTVSVIADSAHADNALLGVGSNYLANLRPGDRVQMAVRPCAAAFHPPADPRTPVVMFCAGSGIAPMRGFIQERAVQKAMGREVGSMLLFFGCRAPDQDFLYMDTELKQWVEMGVVDVRPAFSRAAEGSEGCKYVQDRILKDRADVSAAYRQDAMFFTCGSGNAAKGIKASLVEIIREVRGVSDEEAMEWFGKVTMGRYATDIFD